MCPLPLRRWRRSLLRQARCCQIVCVACAQLNIEPAIWEDAFLRASGQITTACREADGQSIIKAYTILMRMFSDMRLEKYCAHAHKDVKFALDYALQEINEKPDDLSSAETVLAELRSIASALRGQRAAYSDLKKSTEDRRKIAEKRHVSVPAQQGGPKAAAGKKGPSQQGHGKLYEALRPIYADQDVSGCWLCHHNGKKGAHRLGDCPDAAKAQERLIKTGKL